LDAGEEVGGQPLLLEAIEPGEIEQAAEFPSGCRRSVHPERQAVIAAAPDLLVVEIDMGMAGRRKGRCRRFASSRNRQNYEDEQTEEDQQQYGARVNAPVNDVSCLAHLGVPLIRVLPVDRRWRKPLSRHRRRRFGTPRQ
jgi:hypothetical protein